MVTDTEKPLERMQDMGLSQTLRESSTAIEAGVKAAAFTMQLGRSMLRQCEGEREEQRALCLPNTLNTCTWKQNSLRGFHSHLQEKSKCKIFLRVKQ